MKCPYCIEGLDFDAYVMKKTSCLQKVDSNVLLKRTMTIIIKSSSSCIQQSEVVVILLRVLLMPSLQNLSGKEFYQILPIGKHKLKNCRSFGESVFFQKS